MIFIFILPPIVPSSNFRALNSCEEEERWCILVVRNEMKMK
jgi:hypothetical protein